MQYEILGPCMKAQVLTWCDVTSKVGTKAAALKNHPETYLAQFGEQEQLVSEIVSN